MKKIKIFLASSISDLRDDRIALGDFIRQLNEIYIDRGVYISLVKCEDYDNAIALSGKQSEYDREIEDSELCLFLFYRKVGEYTMHELDVAYRSFAAKAQPKIVTYLRADSEQAALSEALSEIITKLDAEYRHYYNVYAHIDTLKLGVLMQLKLMKLDSEDSLSIKDGVLSLGGKNILATENIPIFSKNTELCELYAKRSELERKLSEARERYFELKTAEAEEEFFSAASELNALSAKLVSMETEALSLVSSVAELTSDGRVLTRRQKLALEFFNAGNYQRAQSVLDDEAREEELALAEKRIETAMREVEGYVEENRLWIKAQRARGIDSEAFSKICEKYKKSCDLCERHGLDKTVIYDYAWFLFDNSRNDEAIRVASRLRRLLDEGNERERSLLVGTVNLLGTLWCESKSFKRAEQMFKEGELLSMMGDKSEEERLWDSASSNLLLSNMYGSFDDYENSVKHSFLSMKAYKTLAEKYNYNEGSNIADCCLNLGRAYAGMGKRKEAIDAYLEAVRYLKRDVERDFYTHGPNLAKLANNLSIAYYEIRDARSAKYFAELAIDIFKRCERKNPEQTRSGLATAYCNLGMVLSMSNDATGAEAALKESIERYESLVGESFSAFGGCLALAYVNLGELQRRMLMLDEAISSTKKAVEIYERLRNELDDNYSPSVADAYNNLGAIYLQQERFDEALDSFNVAVELYERISSEKGGTFFDRLLAAKQNLASSYVFLDRTDEAEKAYNEILEYFEKNENYSATVTPCLANARYGLCMIAAQEGDYALAEKHAKAAIEVYEKLCSTSPELYTLSLADAYYMMGAVYLEEELFYYAAQNLDKAKQLYKSASETNPVGMGGRIISMSDELAAAYLCCDASGKAVDVYSEAIELLLTLLESGANHFLPMLPETLELAKNAFYSADERDGYEKAVKKSIECLDNIYGENSELTENIKQEILALL